MDRGWMRGLKAVTTVLTVLLLFAGCATMEDMMEDAAGDMISSGVESTTSSATGGTGGPVDFREGELLAAYEGRDRDDANYLVAKVLNAATADTKGEGEFIFVENGETRWTNLFFETRKATEADLTLGRLVFYPYDGRATFSDITAESYRNSWWYIGRISGTDELYKKVVEINGDPYQIEAVRVSLEPLN